MQTKSIDFYGPGEIDEGMWVQNVDTDELPGQVDYNTWQDHDSRFTTFDPLQEKLAKARERERKTPNGQNEEINQSETVLIMEAG